MPQSGLLRVAVLVDLIRSPEAGGHVKCWERLASAAAESQLPLDLTVYFSGAGSHEDLNARVRLKSLPPLFSTAKLKFIPYVPDHTDLAPHHWKLARELLQYDVIHTTDGFFAFAQTAERVSRKHGIPLVTSFHTDTPSYTRIFARQAIGKYLEEGWLRKKILDDWNIPNLFGRLKDARLRRHVSACRYALVTREEDHALADKLIGSSRVHHLRLGVDKSVFGSHCADRQAIERDYLIPPNRIVVLFVGRVDVGKNIHMLTDAMAALIAEGVPLHLVAAGVGPAMDDVRKKLGRNASLPGFVMPADLAELYASVDCLALSSEVEIRSMVGVEAMASGCPVLVSRKSGVAQLFDNTPAMETVKSSVDSWIHALQGFAASTEKRQAMRAAALDYSSTRLAGWGEVLTEDLFAVWKEAAQKREPITSKSLRTKMTVPQKEKPRAAARSWLKPQSI